MVVRIAVRGFEGLVQELVGLFGGACVSFKIDGEIQVEHTSDKALVQVLDAVGQRLGKSNVSTARVWVDERSYMLEHSQPRQLRPRGSRAPKPVRHDQPRRRVINVKSIRQQPNTEHDATTDVRSPRPRVAQIVLGGEHDPSTAGQLEKTLDRALANHSHLIVDLSPAEFIDSSTIKVLVNAQKAAAERDRRFNLVLSTTLIVERVLEITGVLEVLNRVHSLEEALRSPGAPS